MAHSFFPDLYHSSPITHRRQLPSAESQGQKPTTSLIICPVAPVPSMWTYLLRNLLYHTVRRSVWLPGVVGIPIQSSLPSHRVYLSLSGNTPKNTYILQSSAILSFRASFHASISVKCVIGPYPIALSSILYSIFSFPYSEFLMHNLRPQFLPQFM